MDNADNSPNREWGGIPYNYLMTGVLCFGIILRLIGLNKGIWLDEYFTIDVITRNDFIEGMRSSGNLHPPFYFILLKLWSQISVSEPFLRLLSVIFGGATIFLIMRWAKEYSSPLASLLTGLLYSTLPILLRYSQEIRCYQLVILLTVCAFIYATRIAESPRKLSGYVWVSFCLTLAAATHLIGVFLNIPVLLFIIFSTENKRDIRWRNLIAAISLPFIVFGLEYLFFFKHLPEKDSWWMANMSFTLIVYAAREIVGGSCLLRDESGLFYKNFPILAILYNVSIIGLATVTLAGIIFFANWRKSFPLFIAAICYRLEMILYSAFVLPIFISRTILPGIVPLLGFIGMQIAGIRLKWLKLISIMSVIIISMSFAGWWVVRGAWIPVEDWREPVRLIKAQWNKNDIAIFYPGHTAGPVKYYFTDLPADSVVGVSRGEDMLEMKRKMDDRIHALQTDKSKHAIFFISRCVTASKLDRDTFHKISRYLESICGQAEFSRQSGSVTILEYRCQNE
ncbi:MAG TPA: glycosyltransferase family 39 protein [Smithella sp.]|nr:glycosyltransferase family 39 protein [Smithella sp.]